MPHENVPIVVGGCFRSGTSLLRRILNAHPAIHCGPEVKFFRDFHGDYGDDPYAPLRFLSSARSILAEDDLFELAGRMFVQVHERAAIKAGKRRWADKCPENVLYLADWQRLLGDDWVFVHVVRNPLDTLASIKEAGFPRTIPPDLDGRIDLYNAYTRAGLEFAAAHQDRYRRLTYESLVKAPTEAITSLMQWLDETFEPHQLAFNDASHEQGLEDPKVHRTSGVHDGSVGRWGSVLTSDETATIAARTAETWRLAGFSA